MQITVSSRYVYFGEAARWKWWTGICTIIAGQNKTRMSFNLIAAKKLSRRIKMMKHKNIEHEILRKRNTDMYCARRHKLCTCAVYLATQLLAARVFSRSCVSSCLTYGLLSKMNAARLFSRAAK